MQGKKKWTLNMIFLVLVLSATLYGILHGNDLSSIIDLIQDADWRWWMLGVLLVVAFILGESVVLHDIMRAIGTKHRLSHCFLYSFIGFFVSCITPSAGGGQPAQIYFMKRDGIDIADSVPIMILVTITYKLVLVLYAIGVLIFRPGSVMAALEPVKLWCVLGLLLNAAFVTIYILAVVRPNIVKRFLIWGIRVLSRFLKPEKTNQLRNKLEIWIARYRLAADCFFRRKMMLLRVMLLTILQRSVLFAVTYLTMRSFGLQGFGIGTIVTLQAMIALGTDLLPLPGGTGANETMFLMIFPALCGEALVLPVLLVSRGISYYGQLLISAVFTLISVFVIGRRKGEENEKDHRIL